MGGNEMFFFEHHAMRDENFFRINSLQNTSFPAHLHRAYELIFVHSGTLFLQLEQQQYQIDADHLSFIFCNQIHGFSSLQESEISVVLFSPEIIGDFYTDYKGFVPENSVIRLDSVPDLYNLHTLYAKKGLLYRLCDKLVRSTRLVPMDNHSKVEILQRIFAYVDQHYSEDCTLRSVAKALQYDYTYLSRCFVKQTGMHFTEYLNQYRIARACYLLKSGGHSISDIASICGYATLRSFHRNFHNLMHCSPREYLSNLLK